MSSPAHPEHKLHNNRRGSVHAAVHHNRATTASHSRVRKPRIVKNGYVETSDIDIESGAEYINWINITKSKLLEREYKLMTVRVEALQSVIKAQCDTFQRRILQRQLHHVSVFNHDQIVNVEIRDEYFKELDILLEAWKGINVKKAKKSLSTFRQYFNAAKGWFDRKKKSMLIETFWIRFFGRLHAFTARSAATYFEWKHVELRQLYANHLLFHIVYGIFSGHLQFAATKRQPIIPRVMLRENACIQRYLKELHPTLDIRHLNDWINPHSGATAGPTKKLDATQVLRLINQQLRTLDKAARKSFDESLARHYVSMYTNNNNNTPLVPDPVALSMPAPHVPASTVSHRTKLGDIRYNDTQSDTPTQIMNAICNFEPVNYNGSHTTRSYVVQRYNPMHVMQRALPSPHATQVQHVTHHTNQMLNSYSARGNANNTQIVMVIL